MTEAAGGRGPMRYLTDLVVQSLHDSVSASGPGAPFRWGGGAANRPPQVSHSTPSFVGGCYWVVTTGRCIRRPLDGSCP